MAPSHEEAHRLLRLARRDHAACHALINAPDVAIEMALFHAQQTMEKFLKAARTIQVPKLPSTSRKC